MKKIFGLLLCLLIVLCGCDPYNKKPYKSGNSIWVCKEPNITYVVEMVYDYKEGMRIAETHAITYKEGKEILFDLCFLSDVVDAWQNNDVNDENVGGRILFSGTCKYSENKFIIKVDKETDTLFNGEYAELIFERTQETQGTVLNEDRTFENTGDGYVS